MYQESIDLYGLIHGRFLQSPKGLAMMREKFLNGVFGVCPRVLCGGQNVLPVGMSENLRHSRVKVFCPKCEDVYLPKKKCADVDGAYFGCSFPHILLMTYPDLVPKEEPVAYVPRIFGFKIYGKKGSKFYEMPTVLNSAKFEGERHGLVGNPKENAVKALDENNKVLHSELVSEIANEPNYDAALSALK